MARPSKGIAETQLVVRLSHADRARIEALRDDLSKRAGGVKMELSAVVRAVLERGLASFDRDLKAR
jgi:hypothetical protein